MSTQWVREITTKRQQVKAQLAEQAQVGTEWTSAQRSVFSIAVTHDPEQAGRIRLVRYDRLGPSGHCTVDPAQVPEEIIMNLGMNVRRCDGDFDEIIKNL